MRAPLSWLGQYCKPGMDARSLAERLSMTGTEVERVTHVGAESADGFVLGRVVSAEAHPNADRLRVCSVDVGAEEAATIVCGAPNVAAGQTVAVALPGAVMADGTKLGTAKLRGVESSGMILSESEMELGEGSDGIAVLDFAARAEPGTPLQGVLPISEPVLELEITPNRPDCLGLYGIAREVHAITEADLADPPWSIDADAAGEDHIDDYASVRVDVPELCPRFAVRAFADVEIAPSPLWLKARLIAAGQRPINNVVDITNYVMLLTGQPLHSFDLDRVPEGEVIVRTAAPGERLTTLDDVERTLDAETVVVADRDRSTSIAGIMGGQISEVSPTTTRVLLEAATWDGTNILRTSNLLALRSEASTRFEKQLHPDLTIRALRVASRLLVELCGARLVPGTIDVDARSERFRSFEVTVRHARIGSLLGMEISPEQVQAYLTRLGFTVAAGGNDADESSATVTVPPDRHFDVTREVDLIEEVARVHGLDEHLPANLPQRGSAVGRLGRHDALLRRAEDLLRDAGLDEAITWSFVDPSGAGGLPHSGAPVNVHNPLSVEQSAMRTHLIGGLLGAARHNLARGAERVALFESGRVYLATHAPRGGGILGGRFAGIRPSPVAEPHRIGAVVIGELKDPSWREPGRPADFYDAKGLVELLCQAAGTLATFGPLGDEHPAGVHPARAAAVEIAGSTVGWVGELHPSVLAELDARSGVAFEIDAEPVLAPERIEGQSFEDLTTHPALSEDLAVVADRGLDAERIRNCVLDAGGALLRSATVFDVYEGEQVPEGKRSLALRLAFRAPDRTLTDAEVADVRAGIVAALDSIGASLRG